MRRAIVSPFLIVAAIVAPRSPLQAQTPDAPLPVSIDRIRTALKQPPPLLQVPPDSADMPTFFLEVRAPFVVLQPTEEPPFDPTFGLPSAGELLMGGIEKVRSAAVHYKHRRAERRARKTVDDALAAFCAGRECRGATTTK